MSPLNRAAENAASGGALREMQRTDELASDAHAKAAAERIVARVRGGGMGSLAADLADAETDPRRCSTCGAALDDFGRCANGSWSE